MSALSSSIRFDMIQAGRPEHEALREVNRALDKLPGFGGTANERPTRTARKAKPDAAMIGRIVVHGNDDGSARERLVSTSLIPMQPEPPARRTNRILRTLSSRRIPLPEPACRLASGLSLPIYGS